ncbi:hypothetical protein GB2207_05764 [marine gamma proteobacterium HTCC2207]|jgi:hypothetical protein|uniref:Uncharacterized protein n=1 Tax=gamma proteobacterium HTCC2207 TaxID=314287 RepID=Q1YPW6_9GAMM|nr:hypothetical protein GB2207_05764 [marine gamma proteobacterium HTCC2207] [gamma proteobacterium HTCC2207]
MRFRFITKRTMLTFLCLLVTPILAQEPTEEQLADNTNEALCYLPEFKSITLGEHDTATRKKKAIAWLSHNVSACSVNKLVLIRNARASFLGAADSVEIVALIDDAIEFNLATKRL